MERKIGEIFDFKGETLEVVEQIGCEGCYFNQQVCTNFWDIRGACSSRRTDEKSVIFKKVDKSLLLLIKAHAELVRCGIESEIVDVIEQHLKITNDIFDAINDGPLMTKNIDCDKCPKCGAVEVDAMTPRTVYACGSSDYDQRPNTFNQSEQCRLSVS